MTPIDFPEATRTLKAAPRPLPENVSEIGDLPVWTDGVQCVSCWRLSWRERLSALAFGRAWLSLITGRTQPPVVIEACRRYFEPSCRS